MARAKKNAAAAEPKVKISSVEFTQAPDDMDFEVISQLTQAIEWQPGMTVVGQFMEMKSVEVVSKKGKDVSNIATFRSKDDKRFAVWESAGLTAIFKYASVLIGAWMRLTFIGQKKIKGKRKFNEFEVAIEKSYIAKLKEAQTADETTK